MRLDRSIRLRSKLIMQIRDLISTAEYFCLPHAEILERRTKILIVPKGTPAHVMSYVLGYYDALSQNFYKDALVYGGYINGVFYSTYNTRDDYYGKHGIEPCEYADNSKVKNRGHYWKKDTSKHYFIG